MGTWMYCRYQYNICLGIRWRKSVSTFWIIHSERKPQNKQSNSENNKPKHISSDPGVYDELDYNLSNRNETYNTNQTVLKDLDKKDGRSKQKTVVIISVIVFLVLIAVLVSVLLATNGKFWYLY